MVSNSIGIDDLTKETINDQLWLHNEEFRAFSQVQNNLVIERVYESAGPYGVLQEHLKRYAFAAPYVKDKNVGSTGKFVELPNLGYNLTL